MDLTRNQVRLFRNAGLVVPIRNRPKAVAELCTKIAWALSSLSYIDIGIGFKLPRGYKVCHQINSPPCLALNKPNKFPDKSIWIDEFISLELANHIIKDFLTGWLQEIRLNIKTFVSQSTWPSMPMLEEDAESVRYAKESLQKLTVLMQELGFKVKPL